MTERYTVIVSGSRGWTDTTAVHYVLTAAACLAAARGRVLLLRFGDCPTGVDRLALEWATATGAEYERFEADWARFGYAAGPRRNREMARLGADLCLILPGETSVGTWDCARQATAAGIQVLNLGYVPTDT
jgi:hypothetical protein